MSNKVLDSVISDLLAIDNEIDKLEARIEVLKLQRNDIENVKKYIENVFNQGHKESVNKSDILKSGATKVNLSSLPDLKAKLLYVLANDGVPRSVNELVSRTKASYATVRASLVYNNDKFKKVGKLWTTK